jgi:predicted DNA-binding transcriptional regulator YafY
MMQKYIGQTVTIIYQDKSGAFSKRRIRVLNVDGGKIKAYCFAAAAHRLFDAERVMAMHRVAHVS